MLHYKRTYEEDLQAHADEDYAKLPACENWGCDERITVPNEFSWCENCRSALNDGTMDYKYDVPPG
jgi:hypothetical protein